MNVPTVRPSHFLQELQFGTCDKLKIIDPLLPTSAPLYLDTGIPAMQLCVGGKHPAACQGSHRREVIRAWWSTSF